MPTDNPPAARPGRSLLEAIQRGALAVDGGMGTQLYERGVLFSVNYEELVLTRPELIQRIHEDYLRAGAQLLETNTFGGTRIRLAKHGLEERVREINVAAVAGAVGPTGLVFGGFSDDER